MPVLNCPPTPTRTLRKTSNLNFQTQNPLEKAYRNHLSSPNSALVCTTRVSSQNQSNRRSTDVTSKATWSSKFTKLSEWSQIHKWDILFPNRTQILKDKQTPSIPDESLDYSSERLNSSQNKKPQIKHTRTGHWIIIQVSPNFACRIWWKVWSQPLYIPNLQSVDGSWRSELPRSDAIASIVLLLATAATWCGPHIRATKIAASTVTVQIAPKWPEGDDAHNSFILLPLILLSCEELDDDSSSSQRPWCLRGTDHIFNIPVNQSLPNP